MGNSDGSAPASAPIPDRSPLSHAAFSGDLDAVRELLAGGQPVDGDAGDRGTPLWYACASGAPAEQRLAIARVLLSAGAATRHDGAGSTPLHEAAARGPLALVELLIRHGALFWQAVRGTTPLDAARAGSAPDRDAIVELLDRPVIRDSNFKAAVAAIHSGDIAALNGLLDAHPELLHIRALEPECYRLAPRRDYFTDPKLFWFIANNPTLVRVMPANSVEVAKALIARGIEQSDLSDTLELVMTSGPAQEQGLQLPLIRALLDAGAVPSKRAILVTLGERSLAPIRSLLSAGYSMTAPIAAGLGNADRLAALLEATPDEAHLALSAAVVNRELECVRVALDAGADPNAFMAIHAHSVPLHQAALDEDVPMMQLLIARGARLDIRDKLWNGTPLHWAEHENKPTSKSFFASLRAAG